MTASFTFAKATKKAAKGRVAIDGPSGSGKTYTALMLATDRKSVV
jgi:cytidylate kinase